VYTKGLKSSVKMGRTFREAGVAYTVIIPAEGVKFPPLNVLSKRRSQAELIQYSAHNKVLAASRNGPRNKQEQIEKRKVCQLPA
jgi:hypothetical protein